MNKQKHFWTKVTPIATYYKCTHWLTSAHFYAGSRPCSETHLVKLELKQTWVCLFKVAASKALNLSVIIA